MIPAPDLTALRPRDQILIGLAAHILAEQQFTYTVRHMRQKGTNRGEIPALTLRYTTEDMDGMVTGSSETLSSSEEVIMMSVDFIAECVDPGEDKDPTGMMAAGQILDDALGTIFTDGEQPHRLGGLIWDAQWDGSSEDDIEMNSEHQWVAERVTLMYRVRRENPRSLLVG